MPDERDQSDGKVHGAGPAVVRDERTGREYVSPYRYQNQFETEFNEASRRMFREHGTPTERFALWFAGTFGGFLVVVLQGVFIGLNSIGVRAGQSIVLTAIIGCVTGSLLIAAVWWALRGRRRFRDRFIEQRLCFDCGYALIGAPTDDLGRGRCPECGKAFRVATYLRPPKRYHRASPARQPAPQPARESCDGL